MKITQVLLSFCITMPALIFLVVCGQASPSKDPFVTSFGSFLSPDGTKRLEVTRRKQSIVDFSGDVDFEVFDSASGKKLASDSIGWAGMRWCLCWENSSRLWGYGSDIQYFKLFEFKSDGTVGESGIDKTIHVPPAVWKFLPASLRPTYTTQQGDDAN